MADNPNQNDSQPFRRIENFCYVLLTTLNALESAMRRLHPPLLPQISQALQPFKEKWEAAQSIFNVKEISQDLLPVTGAFIESAAFINKAMNCLMESSDLGEGIKLILTAMGSVSRAKEILYPMHFRFDAISRYFLEKPVWNRLGEYLGKEDSLVQTGITEMPDVDCSRKGYFLYVPEIYNVKTSLPLVVALHGGFGTGREFIWTWLKEARSRRFFLLAPSSTERTWSFNSRLDADKIFASTSEIISKYRVSCGKVLLTGFSDGAIYALALGLMDGSPFSALALVSGVLHPYNLHNAKQKRIYLVHGLLDWMFPVHYAHQAYAVLKASGADILFHEIADLSHTYPREENAPILEWFDSSLLLPADE